MDPQEFIDQLYINLLEQGMSLNEIDAMDIIYYLTLLKVKIGQNKKYIDEIL